MQIVTFFCLLRSKREGRNATHINYVTNNDSVIKRFRREKGFSYAEGHEHLIIMVSSVNNPIFLM